MRKVAVMTGTPRAANQIKAGAWLFLDRNGLPR
jgi:hypothetical protein